jgi:hypothetical protein
MWKKIYIKNKLFGIVDFRNLKKFKAILITWKIIEKIKLGQ